MLLSNPALRRGKPVSKEKLQPDLFQAEEGFVKLIYGRIRQGKSTEAVRVMVEGLTNGRAIYSNIALDLDNIHKPLLLDDRVNVREILKNLFLFKKRFYVFDKKNYNYFDPVTGYLFKGGGMENGVKVFDPQKKGDEIRWLNTLTDCILVYDEGQWLLDSYESTYASVEKRKLITETGHVNRTIIIVAQRTQSVHVNARGNVNQFYRCSKKSLLGIVTVLMVEEFQDMKGQDVDESADPINTWRYLFHNRYWHLFNTHYLRRGRPRSQDALYEAFDLNFYDRCVVLFWKIFAFSLPALKPAAKIDKKNLAEKKEVIMPSRQAELLVKHDEQTSIYDQLDQEQNYDVDNELDIPEETVKSILSDIRISLPGQRVKILPTRLKREEAVPIVPTPDHKLRTWRTLWF